MTQSELISKLNEAKYKDNDKLLEEQILYDVDVLDYGSVRGSANYITVSKQWYDYFNNKKSEMRKEKINKILKDE
jgi:hypothetical protein